MRSSKPARKKLRCKILVGAEVAESVIKEMWRLRLDFLQLRLSEEADWEKFCAICRAPNTLLVNFYDSHAQLQGYYTFAFHPVAYQQRKALLIHAKYYYVRPAYRGHPKITSSSLKLIPGVIRRYGLRQLYCVAFSFPTSYVSLSRTFGGAMAIQKASTPDWEKKVLADYSREQSGSDWDQQQQLIVNQNIPFGEDKPPSDNVQQLRDEYQTMNPNWADGVSMPIMMKLDWPTIKSIVATALRRSKRH